MKARFEYENFWRKNLEFVSSFVALLCAIFSFWYGRTYLKGFEFMALTCLPLLLLSLWRFKQGFALEKMRSKLLFNPSATMTEKQLETINSQNPGKVFIGWSFDWRQRHVQRVYDIKRVGIENLPKPKALLKLYDLFGKINHREMFGEKYIHGVGDEEKTFVEHADFGLHTLVTGGTGSGKTQLYTLLIRQAIRRGEAVIIIDPKGSTELRDAAYHELKKLGKADDFNFFSPSYPDQSCRINCLRNYVRPTQIASRVVELLPVEGSDDFKKFVWRAVNSTVHGIVFCGESPTLTKIYDYILANFDNLLVKIGERLFSQLGTKHKLWSNTVNGQVKKLVATGKLTEIQARAKAIAEYYNMNVKSEHPNQTMNLACEVVNHERAHYSKLVVNIMPTLEMLTLNDLGPLLSPDYDDPYDQRPIVDLAKIVRKNQVLYVNLETLADSEVGRQIGSLLISDLTGVAADRYTFEKVAELQHLSVFVDETAEVTNTSLVQQLNKARGAGFKVAVAVQSIEDFTVAFASESKTTQTLANTSTKIFFRAEDSQTAEYAATLFDEQPVYTIDTTLTTSAYSASEDTDYSSNYGGRLSSQLQPSIPTHTFTKLPSLEYFAKLVSGRTVKGRIPYIPIEQGTEYPLPTYN